MAKHWTDEFSFVTGTVRYKDLVYLILIGDEIATDGIDHFYPTVWDADEWVTDPDYQGKLDWSAVSACVSKHPIEQGVFLGAWGETLFFGSGDAHEERIVSGNDSPQIHGQMRQIRVIDGKAYAVGMARQVYRREGTNMWTCIDQGVKPAPDYKPFVGFDTIDGFSEKEIYAAGRNGEIWIYDGKTWKQIDSPTNRHLTNMCCAGNGSVYICGQGGVLIEGRNGRWQVIQGGDFKEDIWGLTWFGDKLYLSTRASVYFLEDDKLKPVEMGDDKPSTCYHLSSADGVMWSIGPKDVMSFDGKTWSRID